MALMKCVTLGVELAVMCHMNVPALLQIRELGLMLPLMLSFIWEWSVLTGL